MSYCTQALSLPDHHTSPCLPRPQLLKLSQLQLQYLHHQLQARIDSQQALEDESLALAAGLASMPRLSLGELKSGLGALSNGVLGLGETPVDAILEQVCCRGCLSVVFFGAGCVCAHMWLRGRVCCVSGFGLPTQTGSACLL